MNSAAISSMEGAAPQSCIRNEQLRTHTSRRSNGSTADPTPIVHVIDHDVSVRDLLDLLIRRAGWLPNICASTEEFLARPRRVGPCCLVLDINLPGLREIDLQKLVAERREIPVIPTGDGDVPTVVRAMKAGAIDFLVKPFDAQKLVVAIACALDRSRVALQHEVEQQELSKRLKSLTCREREVMQLVIAGRMNKQVGYELGIAEITVKVHRRSMMRKMQARSLAELVRLAGRLNLAQIPGKLSSSNVDARPTGPSAESRKSHGIGPTRRAMESDLTALEGLSRDETHILVKILQRLLARSTAPKDELDNPRGAALQ
jgi:FixJ family two-component response regulator